jgi:parallel beta-helix repeat protein
MKTFTFFLIIAFTQFVFATNYYVSPNGDDNNNGLTVANAFKTIEAATYIVSPGDTILIKAGVYTKTYPESLIVFLTVSGTANNPITIRNFPGENPVLQMNGSNWGAIKLNGCDYIIIDGLTIIGNNDNITLQYAQSQQAITGNPATAGSGIMIDSQYNNEINKPHHIIVRNCKVSKCGGGGIYTYNADYITIENNTVFECAWYTPYGNSGISMYQNWNSDNSTAIKNFITGNTCYRNENFIPWFVTNSILDGNGIIIDDNRNTQNNSTLGIYTGKTYIANNLVFDNGGRGIHCYESDNVIIANNTCYKNCQSPAVKSGEFTAYDASNITYINNIAAPDTGVPPTDKDNNTTSNITAMHNLFTANSTLANPQGTNTIIGNAAFVNPSINAAIADFHLLQSSAAINNGTATNAPIKDKDGFIRLSNNLVDIGCYEYQSPLAITDFTESKFVIYPNPVSNSITFDLKNSKIDVSNVVFYDVNGKKVSVKNAESNSGVFNADVSHLESGMYFVSIIQNKKEIYISKFLKI